MGFDENGSVFGIRYFLQLVVAEARKLALGSHDD